MCPTKLRETDADLCDPSNKTAGSGMCLSFPYGPRIADLRVKWSDMDINVGFCDHNPWESLSFPTCILLPIYLVPHGIGDGKESGLNTISSTYYLIWILGRVNHTCAHDPEPILFYFILFYYILD